LLGLKKENQNIKEGGVTALLKAILPLDKKITKDNPRTS
jgi:hypothetical protein